MSDQYVKNPKDAVSRGKVPEVGERGGIRYRGGPSNSSGGGNSKSGSIRAISNSTPAIFIGEVGDIGVFEILGAYKAYILKDNEKHMEIVKEMKGVLASGGTIFDAMSRGEEML